MLRRALAAGGVLLAGCSTLPPPELAPHRDHHVAAEFVVPGNGRLPLPGSSASLSMRELVLAPPPLGEHFGGDRRWFRYAPGTRVTVRARFRTWSENGEPPADAAAVLAHAVRIEPLAP